MVEKNVSPDPTSFANPHQCVVTDIKLNLEVDFQSKILFGIVDIIVERKALEADLFLDTNDLAINNITDNETKEKMDYILSDAHQIFGSKLAIKFPVTSTKRIFNIRIDYKTSPKACALTWLDPIQTAGKKHPYLFTHCQAIHARSIIPCQDTPSVKAPYSANITASSDLVVLMSAIRDGVVICCDDPLKKRSSFEQKIPIPSYLFAFVVGDLESRQIGPRSHVWCEREYVDEAAEEFSETEKFISVAEELLGPYVWTTYDLLVLPPCFSYGGMENPCLTFVTPTLLAGDKSLVSVIIHEITHSWTGNLVTNSNSEHFWLNEGFTMFVERKIKGRIQGEPVRHFSAILGYRDLEYTVEVMGKDNPLTKLVPNLANVDPEDSFSTVPYEKGHTLLFYLEEKLGSDAFEKFLKAYIEKFKYQSIDTDTWKRYLYEHFSEKKNILDEVDWNAWLYTPGMPPVKPNYDNSCAKKACSLNEAWISASDTSLNNFNSSDVAVLSTAEIVELLGLLYKEAPLSIPKVEKMNQLYEFGKTKNCEIRFRWLRVGLKAHWKDCLPEAIKFVTEQGRMKYVAPIYRQLYEWDEARELAISTYTETLPQMMNDTANCVGKILKLH